MISTAKIETTTCPVTGMPLRRCSEWTEMELDDGYRATIFLLGDRIIVGRPFGYVTMDGVKKILKISQGIIDEYLDPERLYIHIQDYSHVTGADLKARKHFSDEMKKRLRSRAAIFCGQTPWGRIAFQLAVRLHNFPYDMLIARDYPRAALMARKIIMEEFPSPAGAAEVLDPEKPVRNSDWEYEGEGCSAKFEIIEGSVVHSQLEGDFDEKDVEELGRLRKQVLDSIDPAAPVFFLSNMSGITGLSRQARKSMQSQFFKLGSERRIGGVHIYGASAFVRSAVYLGRPFAGVKATVHAGFEEAMGALREERDRAAGVAAAPAHTDEGALCEDRKSSLTRHHVEEVLAYISGQNWDREGQARRPDVGDDHPFLPVFEALDLIKRDLDDLFGEHRVTVEELRKTRDGLWARIAERTADLSAANDRLRQTDLQRSRQAADLSANLRCIFTEIADAIDEKGAAVDGRGAPERIRVSLKAAERVVELFCRGDLPGGDGADTEA